tara:strand:- start:1820 stop:2203 length:384 start_codon:yes stop_codon:yes gene_type:complete
MKKKNKSAKCIGFKIVNEALYHSTIVDVDVSGLTSKGTTPYGDFKGYDGDIFITENNKNYTISGEHGVNDYLDDYGFVLIAPCDVCYGDGLIHSIDEDGEEEIQKCDHCDVFKTDADAKEFINLKNK